MGIAYTEDHFQIVFLAGCRSKFHREHISGSGQGVAPCKVSFDPTSAKEMLLMAASLEDQQQWVTRLLKRIQKSGFKVCDKTDVAIYNLGFSRSSMQRNS